VKLILPVAITLELLRVCFWSAIIGFFRAHLANRATLGLTPRDDRRRRGISIPVFCRYRHDLFLLYAHIFPPSGLSRFLKIQTFSMPTLFWEPQQDHQPLCRSSLLSPRRSYPNGLRKGIAGKSRPRPAYLKPALVGGHSSWPRMGYMVAGRLL
jgi:hypothetical protein